MTSTASRRRRRTKAAAASNGAAADHAAIAGMLDKALDGIGALKSDVSRALTQNEIIIDEQANAARSRGAIHERMNEFSGDLLAARYEIGALDRRVNTIDDGFRILETARLERQIIRGFLRKAFRKGWAVGAVGFGGAVWIWNQEFFNGPREYVLRALGKH